MLHAISFALLDSLNVLLIGVLFAIAVLHSRNSRYGRVAGLLIAGDWFGVFVLSILTLAFFDWIGGTVHRVLDSPVFGIALVLVGVASAVAAFRGGDISGLIERVLRPLQRPSMKTFCTGMALGLIQSVTSGPFFVGLAFLSTAEISTVARYSGAIWYATLALSLPALCGLVLGFVLRFPESPVAQALESLRSRREGLSAASGYLVAVILIGVGVLHLL